MRELGELVDVALDAPDVAFQLGQNFVYVGGNFRHGARKNINVVVAVHFQFAEVRPERGIAGRGAAEPLRSGRRSPSPGVSRGADAIELVLFLEIGDLAVQPLFGKAYDGDAFFNLRN